MNVSRRVFVSNAAAAAALQAFAAPASVPRLRFGLISDIHLSNSRKSADRVFRPALEWFRDQGVDAVVCTGDLATCGYLSELEIVSRTWFDVFPEDRLPDGRHVERVFLYGNHDTDPRVRIYAERQNRTEEFDRSSIQRDRSYAWEHCFHEPYSPVYVKKVKGYAFVAAHWVNGPSCKDAPGFLEGKRAELAGERPFFYCQHAPLRGTVVPSQGVGDDGAVGKVLATFPNAIAFTGHSHAALTDETSVWQESFTAINAAALANAGRRYRHPWFENSEVPGSPAAAYRDRKGSQMRVLDTTKDGGQGMLVEVYDEKIVCHRRSFVLQEPNGPDWVLPLGDSARTFSIASRAAKAKPFAPSFAPRASLSMKVRDGFNREKEPVRQLVVSFPAASVGTRPLGYEVTATSDAPDEKPVSRCILSPDFHLPPTRRVDRAECVLAVAVLPKTGKRTVSVRAFDSFRNYGLPLTAEERIIQS